MTRLHDLYEKFGQSPWIDDLKRSYVRAGGLDALVELGVRGVTSNPTILARAIESGSDYDEQFGELIAAKTSVEDAYWELVIDDIRGALKILRPTFDSCGGRDGFVSLEVSPSLAHDTKATAKMALALHQQIAAPNLFVKIPATIEGLPAIEETIAAGHSVNVTLIFSLERYEAVMEAYLVGLERLASSGGDLSSVASVASFFVSRVDTEIDRRLEAIAADASPATASEATSLLGKAALAQARVAYERFTTTFGSARFAALEKAGARVQRPLWASTSTKNPAYPDLLYVDGLIGPDTVNTMPNDTIEALADHGVLARTIDADPSGSRDVLARLAEVGIDLHDVTDLLEREGVAAFAKSFDELMDSLAAKAAVLGATP